MKLEVKSEKLPKSKVKLNVTLKKSDFDKFRVKAIEKLNLEMEIKGFRKGKAPKSLVIEKAGETRVDSEALDLALPESSAWALAKENIFPVSQPKVTIKQFEKGKDLIFELEAEIMPKIKLPEYRNLKVKKEKAEVADKDLEAALKNLQKQMAKYKDKTDSIKKGDWVEINFEGSHKGVKKDKLCSQNFPFVVGETLFIPGFEEKITGMKKDEEKEFKIKMPDDFVDSELKGQEVDFKVKINGIKEIILPTIDKEFAKKLGAKDVADLKKRFKESLLNQKKEEMRGKYKNDLLEALVKKIKIDLPQGLVDNEANRLLGEFAQGLSQSGTNIEDYLKRAKKNKEEFDKDLKVQAEKNIKTSISLAEISKKEKIQVKEEEIEAEIQKIINLGMQQGIKKSELLKSYETEEGKGYIANLIKNRKAIDKLVEVNQG